MPFRSAGPPGPRGPTGVGFGYSITEFGAAGDGLTDDTTAIQAALNAAGIAGGGLVYAPEGVYLLGGHVDVPPLVDLCGAGKRSTIFTCTTASSGLRFGEGGGSTTTGSRGGVSGHFHVNGNDVATNPLFLGLVVERLFTAILVERAAGDACLRIEQAQNVLFSGVEVQAHDGWGMILDYGAGGLTFDRCQFNAGHRASVLGNVNQAHSGSVTGSGYSNGISNVRYIGCQFERATGAAAIASVRIGAGQFTHFVGGNIPALGAGAATLVKVTHDDPSTTVPWVILDGVFMQGEEEGGAPVGTAIDVDVPYAPVYLGVGTRINVVDTAFRLVDNAQVRLVGARVMGNVTNFFVSNGGTQGAADVIHEPIWAGVDAGGVVLAPALPTSDPGVVNALWNDAGTVKVSTA